MAKRIDTLEAFLEVASSEHPTHPFSRQEETPALHSIRLAMTPAPWGVPIDPRQESLLRGEVAQKLSDNGVDIEITDGPAIDAKAVGGAYFAFARRYFIEHVSAGGHHDKFTGKTRRPPDMKKASAFVESLRSDIDDWMESNHFDAWILPVSACLPFPHNPKQRKIKLGADDDDEAKMANYWNATIPYVMPFTLTGQPLVTLPVGLVGQEKPLPVGVQVVGRRWQDGKLLASCRALESIFGHFHPPGI